MDKDTKWLAVVNQKYSVNVISQLCSMKNVTCATQVVQLSLRAKSAQEAVVKAMDWIDASGIEDAYVGQVCRDDLDEIDIGEAYEDLCEKHDIPEDQR